MEFASGCDGRFEEDWRSSLQAMAQVWDSPLVWLIGAGINTQLLVFSERGCLETPAAPLPLFSELVPKGRARENAAVLRCSIRTSPKTFPSGAGRCSSQCLCLSWHWLLDSLGFGSEVGAHQLGRAREFRCYEEAQRLRVEFTLENGRQGSRHVLSPKRRFHGI